MPMKDINGESNNGGKRVKWRKQPMKIMAKCQPRSINNGENIGEISMHRNNRRKRKKIISKKANLSNEKSVMKTALAQQKSSLFFLSRSFFFFFLFFM